MPRLGALALVPGPLALMSCHHAAPPPQAPAPVRAAPSPPPRAPPPAPVRETVPTPDEYSRIRAMDVDAINHLGLLEDVHFDFDKADIRDADRSVLAKDAGVLKRYDFLKASIEGHCDERGTVEYNLALGERRADGMRDYLVSLGAVGSPSDGFLRQGSAALHGPRRGVLGAQPPGPSECHRQDHFALTWWPGGRSRRHATHAGPDCRRGHRRTHARPVPAAAGRPGPRRGKDSIPAGRRIHDRLLRLGI